MAMQVAGTMTLGDLIARALAMGARRESAETAYWSEEFGDWYVPEYLVKDGRHVPLPTTNDHAVLLDVETVEFVRSRLGLSVWPV